jgi:flagellar biogenesis protein FliO
MKRIALVVSNFLFPVVLLAQSQLGTKADLVSSPVERTAQGTSVVPQFLTALVALGIAIVLLKYFAPKLLAKFNRGLATPLNSSVIVEESASFASGSLQVVTVRGKSILLAISPQGVTYLTDVPSHAPVDPAPAFFELLDEQSSEPKTQKLVTHAVVETEEPVAPLAKKAHAGAKVYASAGAKKSAQPTRQELLAKLQKLSQESSQ